MTTGYRGALLSFAVLVAAGCGRAAQSAPVNSPRLEKHLAFASRFVAAREVDVWLPPGYDQMEARYPVVYMHDGQNLFDPKTSYTGVSWGVDRAIEKLIEKGVTAGAIVVGVWNTRDRFAEYMPEDAVSGPGPIRTGVPGMPPVARESLRSNAYLAFIVSELKPFVDRTYRTKPDRAHTFIMGSSMGGLISAYAVAKYPDVFGGAACLSTHWPAGDGAVVDYLAAHLSSPLTHRFYFDYGTLTLDAGYEPYQQRMDAALHRAGYVEGENWITRKFPGADHSEKSWSARLDVPLRFLLR